MECDSKSGKNIVWKAPLPHYGHSCPIVVAARVFVTCEPGWKSDWPVLLCFDANNGKELWRKELNHLPATPLPSGQQTGIAKAWHEFLAGWARGYAAMAQWRGGDETAKKEADKLLAGAGFRPRGGKPGAPYDGREINLDQAKWKPTLELLKKGSMMGETYREGGALGTACIGHSFTTPVSDGRCVWVATAFAGFFCFDLDGQLKWLKHYPGQLGKYDRNARSPLLHGDLLLSDMTGLCRAMDKHTGQLKWSAPVGAQAVLSPAVITAGGAGILLCDGSGLAKGGGCGGIKAFRLPDGEALSIDGWTGYGSTALVKHDERDVVFFAEGGDHAPWPGFRGEGHQDSPAAVRFSLDGKTLKTKLLWNGIAEQNVCTYEGLVYHGGKLYLGNVIVDALSGKAVAGAPGKSRASTVVPHTRHMLVIAGERLYGLGEQEDKAAKRKHGLLEVFSLDGKKVGQGVLLPAPAEGEKAEQIGQTVGHAGWGYNYGCPFTVAGNRLYARSNDELICLGAR
jgi:hypothetical protein